MRLLRMFLVMAVVVGAIWGCRQASPSAQKTILVSQLAAAMVARPLLPEQGDENEFVVVDSYGFLKEGVNIYLARLIRQTRLPVVRDSGRATTFEQVELQIEKTLHGREQQTLSMKAMTFIEYLNGGGGGGPSTEMLPWQYLPSYQTGAALLLILPVNGESEARVEDSYVVPVSGVDDPKARLWSRMEELVELKGGDRFKEFLAATDTVDPQMYDFLSGVDDLGHSYRAAIYISMLKHATASQRWVVGQRLFDDVDFVVKQGDTSETLRIATAKALAEAATSPNQQTSRDAVRALRSTLYHLLGSPAAVEVSAERLLTADERQRLELVLERFCTTQVTADIQRVAGWAFDWLHGKAVLHAATLEG